MERYETEGSVRAEESVRKKAQRYAEAGQDYVQDVVRRMEDFVKSRPGTALLLAAAAGFLVGRLVRR